MTKKKNIKKQEKDVKELEQELQNELENVRIEELKEQIKKLEEEKEKLERKLKEQEEITKNTQLQYLTLKNDFNSFTNRVKEQEKKMKDEIFEKIILKLLPTIELMMLSYETLPDEFKNHKWTEWLTILHKKILSLLEELNISIIPTVWEEIDEEKHEIIWTKPWDEKNKWKIVEEVKKWYLIKYQDKAKVLQPAKVLIWQ